MSKYNSTLTAERLRELLHYDPETGVFTRLIQLCNRVQVGDIAGFIRYNGYRVIKVGGKPTPYFAHRLAWLYIHGEWPSKGIDHIDGDRANNRIVNLREANQTENLQNTRKAHSNNKTGLLGVCLVGSGSKFRSQIRINGKMTGLGCYSTAIEAHNAYLAAKKVYHPFSTL